ncbi:hypothetical protein QC758_00180 [Halomonas campisalis]|nr:hypothetical protein [Halomonas campisalis]MDR5861385.1 hypothetical protein [Halomonas campisalis]
MDQAAGLRQWASASGQASSAEQCPQHVAEALLALASRDAPGGSPARQPAPTASAGRPRHAARSPDSAATLMVVGLPGSAERHTRRVSELLQVWADEGRRWVGDPRAWRVVALAADSPHLPVLAGQQSRWALWVDSDAEAFRRAYRVLKQVAEQGGPQRLLAVHPPDVGPEGLLENLRCAADRYLGIDLLVLAR